MAKVTAPMLSFGGSGSIANAMVYSKWKGRAYVRQKVTPANPRSTAQTVTRDLFALGNAMWKTAPETFTAAWDLFASGQVLTGRNAWLSSFVKNVRSETDFEAMIFSPGAKGGLPPGAVTPTEADVSCSVAITAPSLPTGWTITRGIAACVENGDPTALLVAPIIADEDLATPFAVDLTGLTALTEYHYGAWFEYEKPNGSAAYGTSFNGQFTTTA